jgi:hypothetical protein
MDAEHDSHCDECGGRIYKGRAIRRRDDGQWVHAVCPPPDPRYELQPGETVCGTCYLVQPCGCD